MSFDKNADNKLSHHKMCYVRNLKHPRTVSTLKSDSMAAGSGDNQQLVQYSLCGSKMGWSACTRSMRKTEFSSYGAGMVLYFQFLKYSCVIMLLLTILSIPSLMLYSSGFNRDSDLNVPAGRRLSSVNS